MLVAAVADGTAGSTHAIARTTPSDPVRRSTLRANEPGFGMSAGSFLETQFLEARVRLLRPPIDPMFRPAFGVLIPPWLVLDGTTGEECCQYMG